MNNLERLKLEVRGVNLIDTELYIYLEENDLDPNDTYDSKSATSKKAIYQSALAVLESIANDVTKMKSIKLDDTTVSGFAESIQARIDQLERKIRNLKTDEQNANNTNSFMLFSN